MTRKYNRPNSILQQTLKTASILKRFCLDELLLSMPNAKENTVRRYITALVQNGNIKRIKEDLYIHLNNKTIKTRIGSQVQVVKQIKNLEEFNLSTLHERSNTSLGLVKKTLKKFIELGYLKQARCKKTGCTTYKLIEKTTKKESKNEDKFFDF